MNRIFTCLLILLAFTMNTGTAQTVPVNYNDENEITTIGKHVEILTDLTNTLTIEQVMASGAFKKSEDDVPSLPISTATSWFRFSVTNHSNEKTMLFELSYPTIDSIWLYDATNTSPRLLDVTGEYVPIYQREFSHQNYIFNLHIDPGDTEVYYLKVRASEQLQMPLYLGTVKQITERLSIRDFIFGLYAGLILVMFLYNLFVFFTVRDKSYLFYVIYIFLVGFTQACVQGYAFRFLYPDDPKLANLMLVIAPSLLGLAALGFLNEFMLVKKYTPRLQKGLYVFVGIYIIVLILGFAGYYQICAEVVQANAGLASIFVIIIASVISREYKPAKFFLIAWSIFLASVVVFVLMNFNLLPYNSFTYYSLQIGSALEVVLLSFALADKINVFRKEKEEMQASALEALRENERIVKGQNTMLEEKVKERTAELTLSNNSLTDAMSELKQAQSQLVESEKMASLGQLTAGIAHEINNPINFVISNVSPLRRDIEIIIDTFTQLNTMIETRMPEAEIQKQLVKMKDDIEYDYLLTEIDFLLKGISDGSERTAEIVKGLRIFARLDENDLKRININEGLDSTVVIVNSLLNNRIVIEKDYQELPLVECYAGKLNQVFLNIITNSIQAIKGVFGDSSGGIITIRTRSENDLLVVTIKDNGPGMTEEVKHKIFEPFFTTKDVGEGTGLGLSIVYNIITKHNGKIEVISHPGEGTAFIITIPFTQS